MTCFYTNSDQGSILANSYIFNVHQEFLRGSVLRGIRYSLIICVMGVMQLLMGQDQKSENFNLSFCLYTPQDCATIAQKIPESFLIQQLTTSADVVVDNNELEQLTGLAEGAVINGSDLERACVYLHHKKRFSCVCVDMHADDVPRIPRVQKKNMKISSGKLREVRLHFRLISNALFRKLSIKGIRFGKDTLRHWYGINSGDVFNHEQHAKGCQEIKTALQDQGYPLAVVHDEIIIDADTKLVDVNIVIERGPVFYIGNNELRIISQVLKPHEHEFMVDEISQVLLRLEKRRYDKRKIVQKKESIEQYIQKRGYYAVSISWEPVVHKNTGTIDVTWTVSIAQKKRTIFEGISFFTQEDIEKNIFPMISCEDLPTDVIEQELEAAYKSKGFFQVRLISTHDGELRIISVHEGQRAVVKKVAIAGAPFVTKNRLKKIFSPLTNHWYDQVTIKKVERNLVEHYVRHGFWEVKVIKEELNLISDHMYALAFTVDEGIQRHLRSVTIEGHEELARQWPFVYKESVPFTMQVLHDQKKWLLNYFYKRRSYEHTLEPIFHEDRHYVDIVWKVRTNQNNVTFGKTVINAIGKIPYRHIARELCYTEGDAWDRKKIDQSVKRLRRLEIFDSISCKPLLKSDATTTECPVLLKVVESDPFEVRARIGFEKIGRSLTIQEGSTYKVGGSIIWRNPLAQMDLLRFDADVTRFERFICCSYHIPWIFNQPIDTLIKVYTNKNTQPSACNSNISLYDATNEGLNAFFGYHGCATSCGINIGIHWSGLFETELTHHKLGNVLEINQNLLNTKFSYAIVEPHLSVDYLDDQQNSTQGFWARVSCKGMIALDKTASLIKLCADYKVFKSYDPVVFGLYIGMGHIFHAPYQEIIPSERFYLGGSRTLRGYELNAAPPLGCLELPLPHAKVGETVCQYVPQGGKSMGYGSLEMRFPLIAPLSGVIFQDVGYLSKDFLEFSSLPPLVSSGFGVRVNTAVGLLRFDIGWKWKKRDPHDRQYSWIFTIGHAF